MERKTLTATIEFERYIAHPYWPERELLIRINKDSGMNRLRSDAKRATALKQEVEKHDMTMDDYAKLETAAARQFYRVSEPDGEIIVPRHQLAGSLVHTIKFAPKNLRGKYNDDSFRALVQISDFLTGKTVKDGTYSRYVKLETSNMRSLQSNDYIERFTATGTFCVHMEDKVADLKRLLSYAVEETGIGACRKMGYGRGVLTSFEEV
jgi:hypothetical protein